MLLSGQLDLEVVAEASDAQSALDAIRQTHRRADIVALVALSLPGDRDAFWLMRAIRDAYPWIPILALGGRSDAMTISRAMFYGADGFVDKMSQPQAFFDAIRRGARREVVLEGLPTDWFAPIADGLDRQRDSERVLTMREREILSVAAEGLTARQIGTRLGVRERTVTTHLCRIYRKLGAESRVGAITAATRAGIIGRSFVAS